MESMANLDCAEWNATLEQFPPSCRDVYFSPEYHQLHALDGTADPACFVAQEGEERLLIPGLRIPILDTAYSDLQTCNGYGGPLATEGVSRDFLERAWNCWRQHSSQAGIVAAFFRLHPLLNNERFLPQDARVVHDRQTIFLDLSGGAAASWANARSQYRNMVNKAQRQGLAVHWNAPSSWDQFETLYGRAMERLEAPAALRFTPAFFKALRSLPSAELASISQGADMEAGSVFLFGTRWCHYHLSARSSTAGNHLHSALLHAAVERAVARDLGGLHLGGGRSTSPEDGLFRFKASTGGQSLNFKVALVIADRKQYQVLCDRWQSVTGYQPSWLLGYRQPREVGSI